jgi:hypothetical protein
MSDSSSASPSASAVSSADTVAAPTSDPPLRVTLLQKGLTQEQISDDGWPRMMWLPQEAVTAMFAPTQAALTDAGPVGRPRAASLHAGAAR